MGTKRMRLLCLGLMMGLMMGGSAWAGEAQPPKADPVKLNGHPVSLEGKTVVLRWNGKFGGDRLLTRLGELLTEQVKGVKVVRMWEVDKSTADVSKNADQSREVAAKIAVLKPDLVIASQAD